MLKKKTQQQSQTAPAQPQQQSLADLMLKSFVAGMAGLFVLALGAYLALLLFERDDIARHADRDRAKLGHNIELVLSRYVDRVNLLAADPNLIELVKYPDARLVRQGDLADMINAEIVLLFAKGEEKLLAGEYPLMSFSELDLVYEADKGGEPRFEYHKLKNGSAHIDIVRPLKQGEVVVGYVLARFDNALLIDAFKQFLQPGTRIELSQLLSNESTEQFISLGDENIKTIAQKFDGKLNRDQWLLSYWQQPQGWRVLGLNWSLFFWLVFVVVAGVLAMVMLAVIKVLDKRIATSTDVLYGYVRDRTCGQWMGKEYRVTLDEFQPCLQNLQNLNWAMMQSAPAADEPQADAPQQEQPRPSAADESERGRKEFERSYVDVMYHNSDAFEVNEDSDAEGETGSVSPAIFRAYDIRGVVGKTLNEEVVYQIGRAFGTEAWRLGEQTVVVGRDGRLSSEGLAQALIKGLCESGRNVIDLGQVPTPVVYFATHYLNARTAVMVTGSHNPVNYNGFKLVLQGETLSEEGIQQIYRCIQSGDFSVGEGSYSEQNLLADYLARVQADVELGRPLKVVVDCGNGVAGVVVPNLLRGLGCEVIELYCDVDGNFPNHHPDPSQVINLQALIAQVKQQQADVGLAFDGDGDRLGVVDSEGVIIWPDRQLMLYARHVLQENAGGQVLYDVKSSRHLQRLIEQAGGRGVMWKSGHSLMKAKLKQSGALLAGEMSGHVFFNDRWYGFDDGLYTAVRLLEILSNDQRSSSEVFAELPNAISTPELLLEMPEGEHIKFMARLQQEISLEDAQLIIIDGVRAEFKHGWGLVRASNTTPALTFRFEADSEEALEEIKLLFREQLHKLAPELQLPF